MFEKADRKVAVALLYDRIKAPKVTAKGKDALAEEIFPLRRGWGCHFRGSPSS